MCEQFVTSLDSGKTYLNIDSSRIDKYLRYFEDNVSVIDGISLNPYKGFKTKDISFLREIPNLKRLIVSDEVTTDLSVVNDLVNLEYLLIGKSKTAIDFGNLAKLTEFRGDWSKKLKNLDKSRSLTKIALWGFKSDTKNLVSFFERAEYLENLKLVSSNLASLDGLEAFINLKTLSLDYMRNLVDISQISALKRLNELRLGCCKKLDSYEPISQCESLAVLDIEKSKPIESLQFLTRLLRLKKVSWIDTKLLGDTSVLAQSLNIQKIIGSNGGEIFANAK